MVNSNGSMRSGIATANSPSNQATKQPSSSLVALGRQAESVPREPRSGPVWVWWREVNPIDGEVCAQPWSNLGMVDLDLTGGRRSLGIGERHRCSPCDVTWQGDPVCFCCGHVADDDWTGKGYAIHDGARRHIGGLP